MARAEYAVQYNGLLYRAFYAFHFSSFFWWFYLLWFLTQFCWGLASRISLPLLNARFGNSIMSLKQPKWKISLWERDTIEPAMLRVPIVIALFILLWAFNLWILDKSRIQYSSVLAVRSAPYSFIITTSLFLGTVYAFGMTVFSNTLGLTIESALTIFYLFLIFIHMIPSLPGVENRSSFFRLVKLVFFPLNTITFSEILLADAFCSLSKVLKDFGVMLVAVYSYFNGTDILMHHDNAMMLVALLASLPFIIRVRQCFIQLTTCADNIARIPVTLNIIKYLSSFPPIWITYAASLGYTHPSLATVIFYAATINSLYSFLWDSIMDWGLMSVHRTGDITFRKRTLLPVWVYPIAVAINFVLRFSWAINRVPGMNFVHGSVIVLIIEVGEVCRRSMWNVFRIEWEVVDKGPPAVSVDDLKQ